MKSVYFILSDKMLLAWLGKKKSANFKEDIKGIFQKVYIFFMYIIILYRNISYVVLELS